MYHSFATTDSTQGEEFHTLDLSHHIANEIKSSGIISSILQDINPCTAQHFGLCYHSIGYYSLSSACFPLFYVVQDMLHS